MTFRIVWVVAISVLGLSTEEAPGQNWAVAAAPYRLRIERTGNSPWPASAGFVRVWPCGLNAGHCDASVFTTGGRPVKSQVLWAKPGDPIKVLFDTSSGETAYQVYLEDSSASSSWRPEAGLIWETRPLKAGSLDSLQGALQAWDRAGGVFGRSPVPQVFNGIHLHGPTDDLAGRFRGYFQAKDAGDYELAIVGHEPAFLSIDGKLLVAHPPKGRGQGRRGEFSGPVKLQAGKHALDFLHFHRDGEMIAEVAWKPPGKDRFELMPSDAFLPLGQFQTVSFEPSPQRPNQLYFEWQIRESNGLDDLAMVSVQFRLLPPISGRTCRWKFDDGTETVDSSRAHLFPRAGYRQVRLETLVNNQVNAAATEVMNVEPRWSQQEQWRDALWTQQRNELLTRDFSAAPPDDLAALVRIATRLDDPQLLTRVGGACVRRASAFRASQAPVFIELGQHYETGVGHDYALAQKAYQAALDLGRTNTVMRDRVQLRLAGLLLDVSGKHAEALEMLRGLHKENLSDREKRLAQLLEGDALLAKGETDRARECYVSAGDQAAGNGVRQSVRTAARVESARNLLANGSFDDAAQLLDAVEWETPLERLSLETGLAMVQVNLGRKEYERARTRCQRLLPLAAMDTQRANLLFALIQADLSLGFRDDAQVMLARLLKDHPYSESAARAKDKWSQPPGKAGQ